MKERKKERKKENIGTQKRAKSITEEYNTQNIKG